MTFCDNDFIGMHFLGSYSCFLMDLTLKLVGSSWNFTPFSLTYNTAQSNCLNYILFTNPFSTILILIRFFNSTAGANWKQIIPFTINRQLFLLLSLLNKNYWNILSILFLYKTKRTFLFLVLTSFTILFSWFKYN